MAALRRGAALLRQLRVTNSCSIEASVACNAHAAVNYAPGHVFHTSACTNVPVHVEDEVYCRQRQQLILGSRVPTLSPDTWVAPDAVVIGDVDLYDKVSIWYQCVLRGDLNNITVGAFSNVQDKTIIHAARTSPTGLPAATTIGKYVTIGQSCVIRSARIEDHVIVGEKSVLMEGSLVESKSVLSPGSVLPPGRRVPTGQLWGGNPAKYIRDLTKDEMVDIAIVAEKVFPLVSAHEAEFLPSTFAYVELEKLREKYPYVP